MAVDSNGINLFGYQIKKKAESLPASFVPPVNEDGSQYVNSGAGHYSYALDIDPASLKNDIDLISKYREISITADMDLAIDEIVNEILVHDDQKQSVEIDFTEEFLEKYSKSTQEKIKEEFQSVIRMLNFEVGGSDIIRRWYVDGRIVYHKVLGDNPKKGIVELRPIDALKIKKVVELKKERDPSGVEIIKGQDEYFIYSQSGLVTSGYDQSKMGLKIAKDSIVYVTSGLQDPNTGMTIGHLHKAIRPFNQLRLMEDSSVIYKLVRAPARRVFYIDTSGMARTKAEQYVKDVMARYKNKQVYNAKTGELTDEKKHLSILEDFWLPRANGGKGTEITTLDGSGSFTDMSDVQYFQTKLYQSLNIPVSRMQAGQAFNLGRSNEISRDEVKFSKFISKLRKRFDFLFMDILKNQLILKGIASVDDWDEIKDHLKINYIQDNYYAELKESEIFQNRLQNALQADSLVGKYFDRRYVQRELLKLTQDDIDRIEEGQTEDLNKNAREAQTMASAQIPQEQQTQGEENG